MEGPIQFQIVFMQFRKFFIVLLYANSSLSFMLHLIIEFLRNIFWHDIFCYFFNKHDQFTFRNKVKDIHITYLTVSSFSQIWSQDFNFNYLPCTLYKLSFENTIKQIRNIVRSHTQKNMELRCLFMSGGNRKRSR